jgi:hypothetical protein
MTTGELIELLRRYDPETVITIGAIDDEPVDELNEDRPVLVEDGNSVILCREWESSYVRARVSH